LGATVLWRGDVHRVTVPDHASGFEAARALAPNLLVVDGSPPEETAFFIRRVRGDQATRSTAIAVLSDSADLALADEELFRRAGANVVLTRPVEPRAWNSRLEELLRVPPRRATRIPVRLTVWSRHGPAEELVEGLALNLSVRGMLLQTPVRLEIGTKLDLSFQLPGEPDVHRLVGQTVRDAGALEGGHGSGVVFLVLRGDARERIAAFVEAETRRRRRRRPPPPADETREWEEELRASEARKAAVLDSALDAILTMDQEGRLTECNRAAEEVLGYRRTELIGRRAAETLVPLSLRDAFRRALIGFLTTGESGLLNRRQEATVRRADGSELPVEVAVTTFVHGGKQNFTAYLRDTSDRRREERRQAAQHAATRLLAEATSVGEAVPRLFEVLGESLDWDVLSLWRVDTEARALDCAFTWGRSHLAGGAFAEVSRRTRFLPGIGVPGRAWSQRQAVWLADAAAEASFARAAAAAEDGLHAVVGLPVLVGTDCLGVLELASRHVRPRDPDLAERLAAIVSQLGQFVERTRAEDALRGREACFRALLENSSDGIALVGRDGTLLYVSGSGVRMLGYDPDELTGINAFELLHPDDVARCRVLFERCLASPGVPITATYRFRHKDGTWQDMEAVGVNRLAEPGVAAIVTNFRDVTERRRAAQSQEASARQLQALFERAGDAIVISDDDGRCVEVNPAACTLSGRARELLVGGSLGELFESGFDFAAFWGSFRRERASTGEFRLQRPDGEVRIVEFSATADVIPGSHLAVLRDITERRALEEQLRQSQKIEAVGRLAGGIAHDFNNLLAVIQGYCTLSFARMGDRDVLHRNLEQIRRATERAASLTRQLLAFSRKQVLVPQVLDLKALVSDLDSLLQRLIGEDIDLLTVLAPDLGKVKADPGQIEQVIVNLAVNARDAMPRGGRLTLDLRNVDLDEAWVREHMGSRPGPYVRLSMTDSGVGMDPETRSRIFEPFFTTKEKGKGTGLGLATVYGIVKQSDGYIWVDSEPGRGSTFQIYLPRVDEVPTAAARPPSAFRPTRGTETVLVVEDEPDVRGLAREILESYGYRVLEAAGAEEALQISRSHQGAIHILVTDVVMPGFSGPVLASRLRASRPDTRVLYISGYTDAEIVHRGVLQRGANLLEKPFTPDALVARVREVLDGPASPGA
jgi:PAS domain S-box-containing protein